MRLFNDKIFILALQEIPAQKSSKAKAFDFSRVTKIVSLPTKNANLSQTALAPTALLTTKDFYSVKKQKRGDCLALHFYFLQ